jgi:hypothetical protein
MLSRIGRWMIARNMASLRAGDLKPLLRMDAKDVRFRFPGDSSFAAEIEGVEAHEAWLQRFVDLGLQIYPDEVVLQGFPWRQTVCVRGHVHLDKPGEARVYDNRYVLWGHISWGKLKDYEVYEDTEQTTAFDTYLKKLEQAPQDQ